MVGHLWHCDACSAQPFLECCYDGSCGFVVLVGLGGVDGGFEVADGVEFLDEHDRPVHYLQGLAGGRGGCFTCGALGGMC